MGKLESKRRTKISGVTKKKATGSKKGKSVLFKVTRGRNAAAVVNASKNRDVNRAKTNYGHHRAIISSKKLKKAARKAAKVEAKAKEMDVADEPIVSGITTMES